MRERKLIQRRRPLERRKRPGFFRVERPRQLWQLDMTSIWVAEHGWCYLNAILDCCTREIVGWSLELRCRTDEAIEEYKALAGYYPGAEARVRYGVLLDRLDRKAEARAVLAALLPYSRRAPRHVRKVQAEWIGMAERALRG